MDTSTKARLKFLSEFALLPLLSGCLNYPAVSTLSASMQKSIGTWQPFVSDYAASCRRKFNYNTAILGGPDSCKVLDDQQKQLSAAIQVLDNYFGALAGVATDTNFAVDDGLKALGTTAAGLGANASKVTAVQTLAATLADLAAAGIRENTMGKLIDQSSNAKSVVLGLQSIFDNVYGDILRQEAQQWADSMQNASIKVGLGVPNKCGTTPFVWNTPSPAQETADQVLFQKFYTDQCNAIVNRRMAIAQLDASAKQLTDALDQLNSDKTRLKDKDVVKALYAKAKGLVDQAQAVQKAFAPTSSNS